MCRDVESSHGADLVEFLDRIERDPSIPATILTGAGDRAFCSGADIAEFAASVQQGQEIALRDFVRRGQRITARIESFPKPIIVAVNGLAHGGGSEITEAAALAIASERAEFRKAEINLGFAPPFGGSQRLPRLIGRKRALRMILTAEPINAFQKNRRWRLQHVSEASRAASTCRSTRPWTSRRTILRGWFSRTTSRKAFRRGARNAGHTLRENSGTA